ncbi:hypothetical protein HD554DRAFT_709317 [Boletus coccyginus]|nr:hypothetical protein HD554DRAFT_709317 [Boletus coccyginus]
MMHRYVSPRAFKSLARGWVRRRPNDQVGGGLLSMPQFRTDFGYVSDGQPILPASWQSAFNSVSSIGGMSGSLSLDWISDRFERRGAVAFACGVSIVGVLIQFLTPKHGNWVLLVGKLINGFALGMFVSCAGGYCAEVSPLALRRVTTASVNLWIDRKSSLRRRARLVVRKACACKACKAFRE